MTRRWVLARLTVAGVAALASAALAVLGAALPVPAQAQGIGIWATRRPLNTLRTEVGGAVLAGRLHVVGSFPGSTGGPGVHEAYNPTDDSWTTLAPLPADLNHVATAELDGKMYVAGGWTPGLVPVATLYRYDPAANNWTTLASMPTARGSPTAFAFQGKIYVIGGNTASGGMGDTGAVEVYDPASNTWATGFASMPTPRNHAMYGVIGGRLHVVGGRAVGFGGAMTTHEAYDPLTNAWTQHSPRRRCDRSAAAVVFKGRLHVLGGEFGPDGTQSTHEAYDAAGDSWATLAPMPTARHGLTAGAIGDTLYAASGGPMPGATYGNVLEAFTFPQACSPRPRVAVRTTQIGPGRLLGTVGTTDNPGMSGNRLHRLYVTRLDNAAVDVRALVDQRRPFLIDFPDRPTSLGIVVQRLGPGPFTVSLATIDDCGAWYTFVGGGATVP
jgi:N-acetylneuraminic acid mutarotase